MSALSERLANAKGDRSIDDVAALAAREGHDIDRSTVARYLNGEHGPRPSDKTMLALAAGFGVDVRELRTLAKMPPGELGRYEPTPEAARLNREQRDALDQLIRTIVRGGSNADAKPQQKIGKPADEAGTSDDPPAVVVTPRRKTHADSPAAARSGSPRRAGR